DFRRAPWSEESAMAEKNDPFRDLVFSGAPSEYRLFRRKILLNVASLEEKHVKLAGPKILTRLTGEAWRATEHLSIAELRSEDGWLRVLQALDEHYKYLPETELNECVDEFLFHLKRRSGEGPTAFVSRFKAVLSRLETLIASERAERTASKRKRDPRVPQRQTDDDESPSSGVDSEEPALTKDRVDAAAAASADGRQPTATDTKGPKTVGSFVGEKSPKRGPPSSGGSQHSRGTQKGDEERAQRRMLERLGRLEVGHLKLKPVFPAVILGHLFMRKYGLSREQRSQVIRSTGGSCKFTDIEKVIRASDYEDRLGDGGHRGNQQRAARPGGAIMAADEGSSLSEPSFSDPEAYEAGEASGSDMDEELEEAFEIHKKARNDAKKAFRSYRDSRKKVREIKKERQPYMPVVALPAGSTPVPEGLPVQPTFRYDRKDGRRGDKDKGRGRGGRRKEEVSLVQTSLLSEFSYMVENVEATCTYDEYEVLSASVPTGMAVVDTGCTTSVVGRETADRYRALWQERGLPEPASVQLAPVQLRGFNGARSVATEGLRWTVRLGALWGQVTTYVIPGQAPFLLSRKVLQGMNAHLDLGASTITSEKHGMHQQPLSHAANGHLLLPLVPDEEGEAAFQVQCAGPAEVPSLKPTPEPLQKTPEKTSKIRLPAADLRKHFQTVMKHTRYTQADVGSNRYPLRMLFGCDVDFAMCAYRPRFERREAFDRPGACDSLEGRASTRSEPECVSESPVPSELQGHEVCDCCAHSASAEEGTAGGVEFLPRRFCRIVAACLSRRDAEVLQKLHVNTGHASNPQMLRLAQRARAPPGVIEEIRKFRCPICEVELKRQGTSGVEERKIQVLTVVDYATDFAQQIVLPPGPRSVSSAFHAVWCRPFGPPRVIYVDPDQRWMSDDFQRYLRCNSITLLDSATESHWQLGRVEVAQKILRMMAQRVWRTSERSPEEVIESCSGVRNEQLKRHGFSSAQWFLGREPRVPGSLADLSEQQNPAVQDAVHAETDFAKKMQIRQQAAEAFLQAHAHTTWSRAIKGRHGSWLGPGRVVGTESFREGSPVPRVIWVVVNGFMYKCSPECLRPLVEDEVAFKQIAQEFHAGHLPEELEQVTPSRRGPAGRYFDLSQDLPTEQDFLTPPASDQEGEADPPADRNVRRRITRDDEYWQSRAASASPRGEPLVRFRDDPTEGPEQPVPKLARTSVESEDLAEYSPSLPPPEPTDEARVSEDLPQVPDTPLGSDTEMLPDSDNLCCEIALDIFETDIVDDPGSLWTVLDECAVVAARPGQKRRVEVSFRKLGPKDRERFKGAMKKEWQSWLENKVTTIAKSKGIAKSRIIGSRWVLTWKKSSDPDDRTLTPKARLVLVGFQDPDLGRIATDSPTLRKESKHIILSICASKGWVIWGADIKTAFLSGDNSNRDLYFRPPDEVKEFLNLSDDDVLRLEKAAYGLAEAPRAWFLRLTRELISVGLEVSQLDPCVCILRCVSSKALLGVCGVHVDDLLGGGASHMDLCLEKLRATLPFGDFRKGTIKYTGAEIRQLKDGSIEVSQEAYIDKMEEVSTKPYGKASNPLPEPTLMRACCGQLAWVANHSRPEQAFLASYLQGTQDKAQVAHLELYNKAVRELKTRRATLKFPVVPLERWRLLAVTDAGWGVRANGESQGGLVLCLCDKEVLERRPGPTWIIEWSSKKLRRVVRSSTAAETLAAQNGLDAIEFAQAFLQEVLYGMTPKLFQQWVPENKSGLVIDSKSLYDALTRSACSSALAMEKRLAIDYAIARACLSERGVLPFWTNNLQMVADCLTKLKGNKEVMYKLLDTCCYHVRPSKESGRLDHELPGCDLRCWVLQYMSSREPLARDELVQFVSRAVANNQVPEVLQEIEVQRPDKMIRRDQDVGRPKSSIHWSRDVESPTSMASDTPSTREYLLVHGVDHSKRNGPPIPTPVNAPARNGPPPPAPVNGTASGDYRLGHGGRDQPSCAASPHSAGYGRPAPRSVDTFGTMTSDAETDTSFTLRSPAEENSEEYVLPTAHVGKLPRGIPSLARWGQTLLILPKYKEKKWSYLQLLQFAWNDKDAMSYIKWVKNTYYHDAKDPKGGKASDLAAFVLACDCPIDRRYQEIHNSAFDASEGVRPVIDGVCGQQNDFVQQVGTLDGLMVTFLDVDGVVVDQILPMTRFTIRVDCGGGFDACDANDFSSIKVIPRSWSAEDTAVGASHWNKSNTCPEAIETTQWYSPLNCQ
ncbi:RE1, partial [Symbiodinium sp. CCMP2456]